MADEDVGIFVSYAHDDDLTTGSEDEDGFVSFLYKKLQLKLRDLGATKAKLWIDRRRIADGDLFDGAIDEGLQNAELLVVVMSPNWMQRPYCRKELEAFADLRRKKGVANVQERMIVVGKWHVERLKRPFDLQGQEGFLFYARDETNGVSDVTPFFNRGKTTDQFYDRRDSLAIFLQKRVDRIAAGAGLGTTLASRPSDRRADRANHLPCEARERHEGGLCAPRVRASGKGVRSRSRRRPRIFPATAARSSRSRKRSPQRKPRSTSSATNLASRRKGSIRSSSSSLRSRAKKRAANADPSARGFRRVVWAPKIIDTGEPSPTPAPERDPLQALERCDKQIATDKIDGDILSKFIEFLFQYLAETAPKRAAKSAGGRQARGLSLLPRRRRRLCRGRCRSVARKPGQNPGSGLGLGRGNPPL